MTTMERITETVAEVSGLQAERAAAVAKLYVSRKVHAVDIDKVNGDWTVRFPELWTASAMQTADAMLRAGTI